ncbi:MAG: hypothetical protein H0X38_02735 [Planctomycetes bacterium]|nr:hypothetical protein [Planctomycetota bacterium]
MAFALLAAGALAAALVAAPFTVAGALFAGGGALQVDRGMRRGRAAGGVLLTLCGLVDLVGGGLLCLRLSPRPAIPGLILASFLIGNGLVRLNGAALVRCPGWRRQAALGALAVVTGMASLLDWAGGLERPLAAAVAILLVGLAWSSAPTGAARQRTST